MSHIDQGDFGAFFRELWGHPPFPWQERLVQRVLEDGWPRYIDLPTASGKTACLDIAVFAMAVQASLTPSERTVGRRIFFAVNRRVIVDEAYRRAAALAEKLSRAAHGSTLAQAAMALREVSGDHDAPPLDAALMRGGIVKDNRWARSITQPTIVTTTIDQLGSRLLFRGYGVSEGARPVHAGLIAHDSLLLLDEAHISQPFTETLSAFRRYRDGDWGEQPIGTPFHFAQMTATPPDASSEAFRLDEADRAHPVLRARHAASRPVTLHVAGKAKGKNALDELAKQIAVEAVGLFDEGRKNIAVVVNRVKTARLVAEKLPEALRKGKKPESDIRLAIGRMRPLDRDALTREIQRRVGADAAAASEDRPLFVVATQCLEVGADFDFDGMVSECASLDALRQRFGRLNRRGRDLAACGAVTVRDDQKEEGKGASDDPIYGEALTKTWRWLQSVADGDGSVDFGVNAMEALVRDAGATDLLAPRLNAPVMFPAYVDLWAQTSPAPALDPEVALFLHGPERGEPDVHVCWRHDLNPDDPDDWAEIVSLCPPASPECMAAPIGVVRKWLAGQDLDDGERSDTLDARTPKTRGRLRSGRRPALLWRGPWNSKTTNRPSELRPGDTLVLPLHYEGWDDLGHKPPEASADIAERASRVARGITVLRLRPSHMKEWPETEAVAELREWLSDPESDLRVGQIRQLLAAAAPDLAGTRPDLAEPLRVLGAGSYGFDYQRYPGGRGAVFTTRRPERPASVLPSMDDGQDAPSRTGGGKPVPLGAHLDHVIGTLDATLIRLGLTELGEALRAAIAMHDWGKADERFQAMLLGGDLDAAWAQRGLLAKSARMPASRAEWQRAAARCGYPQGFRHEMLSAQLAAEAGDMLPTDALLRDLALHLIAAHHGRGRPFAPVVPDDDPPDVDLARIGVPVSLPAEARLEHPPHRLDSGIAERYWSLTRRFGWWGLAYLETIVRLADQRASAAEEASIAPDALDRTETMEAAR